jgi:hypothetical protein
LLVDRVRAVDRRGEEGQRRTVGLGAIHADQAAGVIGDPLDAEAAVGAGDGAADRAGEGLPVVTLAVVRLAAGIVEQVDKSLTGGMTASERKGTLSGLKAIADVGGPSR